MVKQLQKGSRKFKVVQLKIWNKCIRGTLYLFKPSKP